MIEEHVQNRRDFLCAAAATALAASEFGWLGSSDVHGQTAAPLGAAPSKPGSEDEAIRPFRIETPEEVLTDLRRRIAATRWPDREVVNDESQGVRLATMQQLGRQWGNDYDWRKR